MHNRTKNNLDTSEPGCYFSFRYDIIWYPEEFKRCPHPVLKSCKNESN